MLHVWYQLAVKHELKINNNNQINGKDKYLKLELLVMGLVLDSQMLAEHQQKPKDPNN